MNESYNSIVIQWIGKKYTNLGFHREYDNIAFVNNLSFFEDHQFQLSFTPQDIDDGKGEDKVGLTSSLVEKTLTPKDSKTSRRLRLE